MSHLEGCDVAHMFQSGEKAVDRFVSFFKSKSFAVLLFHIGVLIFNWPILTLSSDLAGFTVFRYIFIAWFAIVCLLIVVSQSLKLDTPEDRKE